MNFNSAMIQRSHLSRQVRHVQNELLKVISCKAYFIVCFCWGCLFPIASIYDLQLAKTAWVGQRPWISSSRWPSFYNLNSIYFVGCDVNFRDSNTLKVEISYCFQDIAPLEKQTLRDYAADNALVVTRYGCFVEDTADAWQHLVLASKR